MVDKLATPKIRNQYIVVLSWGLLSQLLIKWLMGLFGAGSSSLIGQTVLVMVYTLLACVSTVLLVWRLRLKGAPVRRGDGVFAGVVTGVGTTALLVLMLNVLPFNQTAVSAPPLTRLVFNIVVNLGGFFMFGLAYVLGWWAMRHYRRTSGQ